MYIVNDRPSISVGSVGPGTTPTLKLARHGGGTVGGPVRVYTGNPMTYVHQGNQVIAHETVHLSNANTQSPSPEYTRFSPQVGGHPANQAYLPRPGGFAWPDTSIGAFLVQRLRGLGNYPPQPGAPGGTVSAVASVQTGKVPAAVSPGVIWGQMSHQGELRPSYGNEAPHQGMVTSARRMPSSAPVYLGATNRMMGQAHGRGNLVEGSRLVPPQHSGNLGVAGQPRRAPSLFAWLSGLWRA